MEAVVASPQPLIRLLGERLEDGIPEHEPMLEVLTRRYYKIRNLHDVQRLRRDGRQLVTGLYERDDRRVRLVSALAERPDLAGALAAVGKVAREADGADSAVVDVYLAWRAPPDGDAMADELRDALAAVDLPDVVRRVAVSVAGVGRPLDDHFTFRPGEAGFAEERVVRGLHPMIARRLRLWRLDNFELSRLPSPEDTYLFHCAAREAPADERLVALGEVRDLTALRDADGALSVAARGRAQAGGVPGGHPAGPGRAAGAPPPAREPRLPLRLAAGGPAGAGADRGRPAARAHDRGPRHRGGAAVLHAPRTAPRARPARRRCASRTSPAPA